MTVTVEPATFSFVAFDAEVIRRTTQQVVAMLAIDRPVHVAVDETTPLARVRIEVGDTITVHVESGALEDTRRPRALSEAATVSSVGRALLHARDRLSGGFGEAPADDDLTLRQAAAWDTYCAGRLSRLGVDLHEQRWRYNFRNRHGFTDLADDTFERIWAADALTWGELEALSSPLGDGVSS